MRALFLGEGELSGPARYLAAIFSWSKISFDHRPDQARLPKSWRFKPYDVVILSDYRYASWTPCAKEWLIQQVRERGTGLLMMGGWASFTGLVGGYGGTDIEKLLPVTCVRGDDRVQKSTGALLLASSGLAGAFSRWEKASPSPIGRGTSEAEGEASSPVVCGYHRAKPKPGTQVPYVFRDLIYKGGHVSLGTPHPALVLGHAWRARTAAFLTDCAPHWAGGLVDWGKRRVTVKLRNYGSIEVGEQYLRFFRSLLEFVAQ